MADRHEDTSKNYNCIIILFKDIIFSDDLKILKHAVQLVITDKGFDLATKKAKEARLAASRLLTFLG